MRVGHRCTDGSLGLAEFTTHAESEGKALEVGSLTEKQSLNTIDP